MRLAPVPVFYHSDAVAALLASDAQSKVTHASALCLEACRLATTIILGFLSDNTTSNIEERKKLILSTEYLPPNLKESDLDLTTKEVKALRAGEYKTKDVKNIKTSGFVIHSLEAALWALWNTTSFEEVLTYCYHPSYNLY